LLARGVPETAGLSAAWCTGRRWSTCTVCGGEAETRALIAQENRRYARRQLIWFRKEPNLVWLEASGEQPETAAAVESILAKWPNFFPHHRNRHGQRRIGELGRCRRYGDQGSNTLGNIARRVKLSCQRSQVGH
jgi:hypothetical protein